jgi:hypothetical protein
MPSREIEILIGAAYRTSTGNWQNKVIYLNDYAWKQIVISDYAPVKINIDKVILDLKNENDSIVTVLYNTNKIISYRLLFKEVINSSYGNGMVYFFIKVNLSKWSIN